MVYSSTCVLLFVKQPQPGRVKTRLGKDIGFEQAAQLYHCFGLDTITQLRQLGLSPLVCYAPAQAAQAVATWLGTPAQYRPQQGDHLGARMADAFAHSFQAGYQQTLIVGSDSPDLPLAYLHKALAALNQGHIVLGPSDDGGYYALGFTATNYYPQVFADMPWSTAQVLSRTQDILRQQPYPVEVLPTWYDIDTLPNLQRFYERNLQHPHMHSMVYLSQHDLFS